MQFDESMLAQLASDIWSSMLGIERADGNGALARLGVDRTLTGCVQITGDWAGAVTLRCPTSLARSFASIMFDCDPDSLGSDEVFDALGELTNMTGGTVKGLVNGTCQLGIPAVAEGREYALVIPRGRRVVTLGFEHEGEPIEIVVYETA
jgi:CheY-specific phosphatase CheX